MMTPSDMMLAAGGRRFLLTIGSGLVSTLLVWYAKIDGPVFRDIFIATVVAYLAANTAQKIKGPP